MQAREITSVFSEKNVSLQKIPVNSMLFHNDFIHKILKPQGEQSPMKQTYMDTAIRRDFNTVAKFGLYFSMFAVTMEIINGIMILYNYPAMGISKPAGLTTEIIIDFLIIASAMFTFMKKKAGLIALILLIIIRLFVATTSKGDVSLAAQLGTNTAITLRDFGLFAVAMFFRKDGVSGWASMLMDEEYLKEHNERVKNTSCLDNEDDELAVIINTKELSSERLSHFSTPEVSIIHSDTKIQDVAKCPIVQKPTNTMCDLHKEDIIIEDSSKKEIKEHEGQNNQKDNTDNSELKRRIDELEEENAQLKLMYADLALKIAQKKEI